MTLPNDTQEMKSLTDEVKTLRTVIERMGSQRYLQLHNSIWKMMGYQLLRGLAFGLGSFLGATIVVSSLVYILSFIDFLPLVGDWAKQISSMIKN